MDRYGNRNARPRPRRVRIFLASIAAVSLHWCLAPLVAASNGLLEETASRERWEIGYSGSGMNYDGYSSAMPVRVSGTFSFEIDEAGQIRAPEAPATLSGSWGGSGGVSLRYFREEGNPSGYSWYSREEITFTGVMTSDEAAEGWFDLDRRWRYMAEEVPHWIASFTEASGSWSAKRYLFPEAGFIHAPDHIEAEESVTFSASASHDPDGTIVGCAWDFGDGTTAQGAEVNHVYEKPGQYTVCLRVTDSDALEDEVSQVVKVLPRLTISLQEGVMAVAWYEVMGARYQLQSCRDLSAAPWTDIGPPVDGTDSSVSVPVVDLAGLGPTMGRCFYRIAEPE